MSDRICARVNSDIGQGLPSNKQRMCQPRLSRLVRTVVARDRLRRLLRPLCLHRNQLGRAVWIGFLVGPDVPALVAAVILNERVLTGMFQ